MSQRTERVDELLRQEIGEILRREVQDPRIGFATVTEVETQKDLSHARVWVSVIGQRDERTATIEALGRAMPFVRRMLGQRLRMKRIPELHVKLDDSAERGTRVLHLIEELEAGHVPPTEVPEDESLPTPVARLPLPGETPEPDPISPDPDGSAIRGRGPRRRPGATGRTPKGSRSSTSRRARR